MGSIESIGALSCKLQMLYLVLSYRDMGSAGKISEEKLSEVDAVPIEQDIRGLQHRIGENA